jgi:prepilin-type processing-associated H-X9-DG protein
LLLPAISAAKVRAQSTACQNNLRQLQIAYSLYSSDGSDSLVNNNADLTESGTNAWVLGNVQRYTANYDQDITGGSLYPQIKSLPVYHCPASGAYIHDQDGHPVTHNRSYSLSVWLGSNIRPNGLQKSAQARQPSGIFAFIDENAVSIDNGTFGVHPLSVANNYWNLPASRHALGCNLSFMDGHAEHWKWTGPYLIPENQKFGANDTTIARPDPDINPAAMSYSNERDPDLIRLASAVPVQ